MTTKEGIGNLYAKIGFSKTSIAYYQTCIDMIESFENREVYFRLLSKIYLLNMIFVIENKTKGGLSSVLAPFKEKYNTMLKALASYKEFSLWIENSEIYEFILGVFDEDVEISRFYFVCLDMCNSVSRFNKKLDLILFASKKFLTRSNNRCFLFSTFQLLHHLHEYTDCHPKVISYLLKRLFFCIDKNWKVIYRKVLLKLIEVSCVLDVKDMVFYYFKYLEDFHNNLDSNEQTQIINNIKRVSLNIGSDLLMTYSGDSDSQTRPTFSYQTKDKEHSFWVSQEKSILECCVSRNTSSCHAENAVNHVEGVKTREMECLDGESIYRTRENQINTQFVKQMAVVDGGENRGDDVFIYKYVSKTRYKQHHKEVSIDEDIFVMIVLSNMFKVDIEIHDFIVLYNKECVEIEFERTFNIIKAETHNEVFYLRGKSKSKGTFVLRGILVSILGMKVFFKALSKNTHLKEDKVFSRKIVIEDNNRDKRIRLFEGEIHHILLSLKNCSETHFDIKELVWKWKVDDRCYVMGKDSHSEDEEDVDTDLGYLNMKISGVSRHMRQEGVLISVKDPKILGSTSLCPDGTVEIPVEIVNLDSKTKKIMIFAESKDSFCSNFDSVWGFSRFEIVSMPRHVEICGFSFEEENPDSFVVFAYLKNHSKFEIQLRIEGPDGSSGHFSIAQLQFVRKKLTFKKMSYDTYANQYSKSEKKITVLWILKNHFRLYWRISDSRHGMVYIKDSIVHDLHIQDLRIFFKIPLKIKFIVDSEETTSLKRHANDKVLDINLQISNIDRENKISLCIRNEIKESQQKGMLSGPRELVQMLGRSEKVSLDFQLFTRLLGILKIEFTFTMNYKNTLFTFKEYVNIEFLHRDRN